MPWIRTQTNQPEEMLVNLDRVESISVGAGIWATFRGTNIQLTYFDGPEADRLCRLALSELWAELRAGVKYIDMRDVCEAALELSVTED